MDVLDALGFGPCNWMLTYQNK